MAAIIFTVNCSSWSLRGFWLTLQFPLDTSVSWLPPSLQHLVLELQLDLLSGDLALSMFEELKELQKLELVLTSLEEEAVVTQRLNA